MKRIFVLLSLLLLAIFLRPNIPSASAARSPLVLAFYYAWFDEQTWRPDNVVDYPKIQYTSKASEQIAYHILQAKNAGIDAFVVSWWGRGNPTEDNFKIVLDQAQQVGFKAAIDFELTSPFYNGLGDAVRELQYAQNVLAKHPAYLKVDGKPVIFFWRQQFYSVDQWAAVRAQIDPNQNFIWIAEGIDESYQRVFDGHHLYMVAWAKNVYTELNKWPRRVKKFGAEKIWVATVNPGADNRKAKQPEILVRDRENGAFYKEMWRAAFSTSPDWIIINSWNEWVEGTMIEPSVTYGDLYLNITREFAAIFHAGLPPPTPTRTSTPRPTATPLPTRTPTIAATRLPTLAAPEVFANPESEIIRASIIVSGTLRVRAEPNTSAAILGRLPDGAAVILHARDEKSAWYQIAYPNANARAWISADFAKAESDTALLPVLNGNAPAPTATPTLIPETPPPATSTPTINNYVPSSAPFDKISPP